MPAYKYNTKGGVMWLAKINYIDTLTGKSTQKIKRGFTTKREAIKYENEFKVDLEKNRVSHEIGPQSSFTEVYEAYSRHIRCKELRPDTVETKTSMINHYILPFFEKYTIGEVDEEVITDWKDYMLSHTTRQGHPLSDTYLHSIQAQLNAILNYAVKKRYIQVSPMLDLKNLGSKYADEHEIWMPEEFDKFATAAMYRPKHTICFLYIFGAVSVAAKGWDLR